MTACDTACPLCGDGATTLYFTEGSLQYRLCAVCALIFVPPAMRPTSLQQVLRYLQHENRRDDAAYIQFLRRLTDPLCVRLSPGARGLDFGSGPIPVLGELLTAAGFPTASYDPIFAPDERPLEETYDFITCSEVVEHMHNPDAAFDRFARMLRPGGVLAVMTRFYGHEVPFAVWWYRRDRTHVCFYCEETMRFIAKHYQWNVSFPAAHVALFSRSS